MYTESAGELAPLEEQKILRAIFHEKGINLSKSDVRVRSHGRRRIEIPTDEFCKIPYKILDEVQKEFDRRIAVLPE